MKPSKILLTTLIVLLYFSVSAKEVFQYKANNSDSTIGDAIEGTYPVIDNTHLDELRYVGNLDLKENNYSFECKWSFTDRSQNIPNFVFFNSKEGNFKIDYRNNINYDTKLTELRNHQIIGAVSFIGNTNEDSEPDVVSELLLRIDTEKEVLYFHSLQSEFQTWGIEKPIEIQSNFNNSSEVPDTLQLLLQINNILPIGWGTKYTCDIKEVKKGYLDSNQETIIISLSVGNERFLENIDLIETDSELLVTFVNSGRTTDKPYTPAGTTGFANELGEIWEIITIEESNISEDNNNGDIKLFSDDPSIMRAEYLLNRCEIKFFPLEIDHYWNKYELVKNEYYFKSKDDEILLSLYFFEHQKNAIEFAEANFPETNEFSNWGVNGPMLFHIDGKNESDVSYLLGYFAGEE